MTISEVLVLVSTIIVVFTCIYILIFVSRTVRGLSITVNMKYPEPPAQNIPSKSDIEALQKALDDARAKDSNTTQGIDSMLTELNMYMTGGISNVQDK